MQCRRSRKKHNEQLMEFFTLSEHGGHADIGLSTTDFK